MKKNVFLGTLCICKSGDRAQLNMYVHPVYFDPDVADTYTMVLRKNQHAQVFGIRAARLGARFCFSFLRLYFIDYLGFFHFLPPFFNIIFGALHHPPAPLATISAHPHPQVNQRGQRKGSEPAARTADRELGCFPLQSCRCCQH